MAPKSTWLLTVCHVKLHAESCLILTRSLWCKQGRYPILKIRKPRPVSDPLIYASVFSLAYCCFFCAFKWCSASEILVLLSAAVGVHQAVQPLLTLAAFPFSPLVLFIFGCWVSVAAGKLSQCTADASDWGGFSHCRAQALAHVGSRVGGCGSLWSMGLVALGHVESSQTR